MKGETILVATDLSDNAAPAAKVGQKLADALDRDVEVMHVLDLTRPNPKKGLEVFADPEKRREAEERVEDWFFEASGAEASKINLVAGGPVDEEIRDRASDDDVACLVIAMSGRGAWNKLIFGSTAIKLAGRPPCMMAVAHPKFHRVRQGMTLAVGTDFTATSDDAVATGALWARTFQSPLHLVYAHTLPSLTLINEGDLPSGMRRTEVVDWAEESMQSFVDDHAEVLEGVDYDSRVVTDHPVAGLREFVEQRGVDWMILGHRRPEERAGAGTVKGKWVQQMNCSTLIVPRGAYQ